MEYHFADVLQDSFDQEVIERSQKQLVVVDFWAPWCGPCRALMPILEQVAQDYNGKIFLAKVNVDENQALAQQFQVRGVPAVKFFLGGQIIDEFNGALPEQQVREMVEKCLPPPYQDNLNAALELSRQGKINEAIAALEQLLQAAPDDLAIKLELSVVLRQANRIDEAEQIISNLPINQEQDPKVNVIRAKLKFARDASGLNLDEAKERIKSSNSDDRAQAFIDVAVIMASAGAFKEAAESLLLSMKQSRSYKDGAAKKDLLALFDLLDDQPDLVHQLRREMSSLLL